MYIVHSLFHILRNCAFLVLTIKNTICIICTFFNVPNVIFSFFCIYRFVIVIVFYARNGADLDETCQEHVFLHVYFVGLIVFLVVTIILEVIIVHISRKGTISDSGARRYLPIVLYIRVVVAVPEVAWNAYGTWAAFEKSSDCQRSVVNVAKGTVIAGWIVLLMAVLTCVVLFNLYNGKNKKRPKARVRSFKRASRRAFSQRKHWEKRYDDRQY